MGANKPAGQKQTLRVVAQEKALLEDDGDILAHLKKVRDKYTHRAEELDGKAYGDNKEAIQRLAAYYRKMADAVQRVTGIVDVSTLVEPPAPVDQTETILSDRPDAVTLADAYEGMLPSVVRALEDVSPVEISDAASA